MTHRFSPSSKFQLRQDKLLYALVGNTRGVMRMLDKGKATHVWMVVKAGLELKKSKFESHPMAIVKVDSATCRVNTVGAPITDTIARHETVEVKLKK